MFFQTVKSTKSTEIYSSPYNFNLDQSIHDINNKTKMVEYDALLRERLEHAKVQRKLNKLQSKCERLRKENSKLKHWVQTLQKDVEILKRKLRSFKK